MTNDAAFKASVENGIDTIARLGEIKHGRIVAEIADGKTVFFEVSRKYKRENKK